QQTVSYKGIPVVLSNYPFRLLAALARKPGRVILKAELYEAIYGCADVKPEDDRPYDQQLSDHKRKILVQIRKAIQHPQAKDIIHKDIPNLILVRYGVGYILNLKNEEVFVTK
ncbi:MAG: helix-turn-helix domain-containing protein, partial [Nitrospiria bacterium]